VVLSGEDRGIRFFGLTAGYEFGSLLEVIKMVSTGDSGLGPELEQIAKGIKVPIHLEILVTLTCPYCPRMVRLAHQLAFVNDKIHADMVKAPAFPVAMERYKVIGVPLRVVNERRAFEGALPPPSAVIEILTTADREEYRRTDAPLREARGDDKARPIEPGQPFDIIVVGAGPAGLSAALYAVRKCRRVALIGKRPGGQINDPTIVENYLGMKRIGG
jgi:alkyl hydroperoxide reductase subunit AhpF